MTNGEEENPEEKPKAHKITDLLHEINYITLYINQCMDNIDGYNSDKKF